MQIRLLTSVVDPRPLPDAFVPLGIHAYGLGDAAFEHGHRHDASACAMGRDVTAADLPTISAFHRLFRPRYGCPPRTWLAASH